MFNVIIVNLVKHYFKKINKLDNMFNNAAIVILRGNL